LSTVGACNPKFEVRCSGFRKPRASDLGPLPVSCCYPAGVFFVVLHVRTIEVLVCKKVFQSLLGREYTDDK
jgi:hypothetical protein